MNAVNENVAKLDADLLEMACHLEEKIYPHLLTTISGMRWLLTHGMKLFLVKCLNSSDYLTALGAVISRAIEQGMQSGPAAGIDHGKEGKSLTDSHKDVSVEDVINLLRLKGPLADAPGMSDLQPDVEQLRVPIHRSKDQVVLGETSLSFALSVSHTQPLSVQNLRGAASISDSVPVSTATTTALSTTFASASSILPITIEDYEIVNADGQESVQGDAQGNAASFATVEFEIEELDATHLVKSYPFMLLLELFCYYHIPQSCVAFLRRLFVY
ncbi:hypothetical protein Tco_0347954 [Tanacetum coccineum]